MKPMKPMKLLFCPKCQDIVRLLYHTRSCRCGFTSGKVIHQHDAYYTNGIPMGINNSSLVEAIKNQPESGIGIEFKAFIVPKQCSSFHKVILTDPILEPPLTSGD